ncbi:MULTISPECIES: phosphonate ABC transporter, permease protein PhnE [Roseomonadaceae]|jgi:phosphonate transport system permease protein|uniref:Phosphonate ABC transporter, permease protein PhnE n=1 Tax=Falsiroseomonas oleicola TaxID=2801474 RepID=A0ABS6H1M3_9PROT|nr:phosphonate ABC transporter, permease protein PhnE [Roseomonas oleicola]MBU8542554.1 phosphonate ABC transporter, permease protein PhnE [Roseomonas oleicola]
MAILTRADGVPEWRRRTPRADLLVWAGWFGAVALTLLCFQFISDRTIWAFVWDAPTQGADLIARMFPPRWSYASQLWKPLLDTINMATIGTALAIVIGVPLAFLAAHNTTPSRAFVRPAVLFIIVASRSINSLIWALILVIILGPGLLAGILSIALRSVGFIAKLLYEAIEEIDPTQVEAVTATGASRPQVLGWSIVPQIMPAFAGISVFRWDINIREATVLGLVGAGGIGMQMQASINVLAWPQVTMIFILILGTVLVSEWLSARVRHAVI